MNASKLAPVAFTLLAAFATGCAVETSDSASSDEDLKKAKSVTGANAETLMDALQGANAPSDIPAGMVGVGGRVARLELNTAQGGMAHFISQRGELSTMDGADLGSVLSFGLDWSALQKALTAGGLKWDVTQGDHGASSSKMFAKVECKKVVSPTAKPTCTVTPIVITAADSKVLMDALEYSDAPSNTPAGMVGVGSRIARVTLTTAQGGMAHFISQGFKVETLDGHDLDASVVWADMKAALLDGGSIWTTKNGAHGASSSTIVATVECRQAVSPTAKPSCTVTPEAVSQ